MSSSSTIQRPRRRIRMISNGSHRLVMMISIVLSIILATFCQTITAFVTTTPLRRQQTLPMIIPNDCHHHVNIFHKRCTTLSKTAVERIRSTLDVKQQQQQQHYFTTKALQAASSTATTDLENDPQTTPPLLTPKKPTTYNHLRQPQPTPTLLSSLKVFLHYLLTNIRKPPPPPSTPSKPSIRQTLTDLSHSYRQFTSLVDYTPALLIPALLSLSLCAISESIVPHYSSLSLTLIATGTSSRTALVGALTGLALSSISASFFAGSRGSLFWIAGARGNYNARVKLFRNLLKQDTAFFDGSESGVLLSRLTNDVSKIGNVISFHVNVVLRKILQLVIGLGLVSVVYGRLERVLAEVVQNKLAEASAVAETSFVMSETVRAFNGVKGEAEKYEHAQLDALQMEENQAWLYGTHKIISDTLESILKIILLFSCWHVGRSTSIPTAQLTTFLFYVNYVLESSGEIGDQWAKIQSAIGASKAVFELIGRESRLKDYEVVEEEQEEEDTRTASQSLSIITPNNNSQQQALISIQNMTVTYSALTSQPALSNINLDITPGDRIAIVGRSGSGKTSLLRTILRFYDPSDGKISFQGTNLSTMSRRDVAQIVTIVEQEPKLFPMTLLENVLYGIEKDDGDNYGPHYRVLVERALAMAGMSVADGKMNQMGLTLDTRVGEGGRTLSGGQRQRMAIARALVRRPRVLLLDEPTAALDSKSERTVIQALRTLMTTQEDNTNCCMVMVTHRLNAIRSLDINKIVVLKRGKIIEMGHPEELLRREGGEYAMLAKEQGILPLEEENEVMPAVVNGGVNDEVVNGSVEKKTPSSSS